jgi:hypothetical protein
MGAAITISIIIGITYGIAAESIGIAKGRGKM